MADMVREHAVACHTEATEGTDPTSNTPSNWIATLGDGPKVQPQLLPVLDESVRAHHSGLPHKMVPSHSDVTLPAYVRGKESAAGDAPIWNDILLAAGFDETLNAATSAVYKLVTHHTMAVAPSMTVFEERLFDDGESRLFESNAVRGNLTFTLEMDTFASYTFEGKGTYNAPGSKGSATITASSTYDADKSPLVVRNMTLSYDSSNYCVESLELGTRWALEEVRGTCGNNSLDHIRLERNERAGGSMTFNDTSLWDAILTAYGTDAVAALSITLSDGTDTVVIEGDIQFDQYTRDGGNVGRFSVPFVFVDGGSGDDDITITFT